MSTYAGKILVYLEGNSMYIIVTTSKEFAEQAKINGAKVFECEDAELDQRQGQSKNHDVVIGRFLQSLAIDPDIKGYHYIKFIIKKCIEEERYYTKSITKEIYPTCAREFYTTASKVERAIRHAVERSFDRVPEKYDEIYARHLMSAPCNSNFIGTVFLYFSENIL